ncbi:hypothetical protein IFM61606_10307 [Aspergillus udagawae]|nr:hypothetical protein IFM61606_10307 [Aspergillus udagawae]
MHKLFQILQYNVHRSKNVVMAQFLRDPKVLEADIIAIQEPWDNPFQDTTHQLLYPEQTRGRARVCLYVSRKIDPMKWKHTVHSRDCQELELHYGTGTLRLYNIYNPRLDADSQTDTLDILEQVINRQNSSCLLLGDFNLHHPAWGGDYIRHTDTRSDKLLELTDAWLLDLWTEPGAITRDEQGHQSTINPHRWSNDLKTPSQIEDATDFLIEVVQQAIAYSTPWARPSSEWANPDWTPECTEMVKLTRLCRRIYTETHTNDDWEAYTKVRNRKGKVISRSLQRGHRKRVRETVDQGPRGMWRIAKRARNRAGGQTGIIPTLCQGDHIAETAEQKVNLLCEAFFPAPPQADISDIQGRVYDQSRDVVFPDINEHEIIKAIRKAPPDKAPGLDAIPNKVWHALTAVSTFIQALKTLFNACICAGHNPRHFQASITSSCAKQHPETSASPSLTAQSPSLIL